MMRWFVVVFGVFFIGLGAMGFSPSFVENGDLFGVFAVDSMHNYVHIVSGVIALFASFRADWSRMYFKVFGIIYAAVAVLGFFRDGDLFMMHVNMADNYLHVGIAVVALYLGFFFKR